MVRKVSLFSGVISTVAGTGVVGYSGDGGQATAAQLTYPQGLAVDPSNNLYVADFSTHVRKVTLGTGIISTTAGTGVQGFSGDGGPATQAQFGSIYAMATDKSGNLYLLDYANAVIRVIYH